MLYRLIYKQANVDHNENSKINKQLSIVTNTHKTYSDSRNIT